MEKSVWIGAALAVAALAHAPTASAQVYKCADASGKTTYSDKPCEDPPGKPGKQEVLRVQKNAGYGGATDNVSAMCARYAGSPASESTVNALPENQREVVKQALRGVIAGMARDPRAQGILARVTLTVEPSGTAVICVPRPRQPGQTSDTYVAFKIEPNGRTQALQPTEAPIVTNDANEPATMAARCAGLVTSCVRQKAGDESIIDGCFDSAPTCPAGRQDVTATCCPQACKDNYRRERSSGTDPQTAVIKVIFGDESGAQSCIPGMPNRGR